jgi:hypothetical protein
MGNPEVGIIWSQEKMYYINLLLEPNGQLEPGDQTEILKKDLRTIITLAAESETSTFLDGRIVALDEKLARATS